MAVKPRVSIAAGASGIGRDMAPALVGKGAKMFVCGPIRNAGIAGQAAPVAEPDPLILAGYRDTLSKTPACRGVPVRTRPDGGDA
ncbi:hypothetical protein [Microvirga sp. M2]|uniref:hypothetical protein n=1 Tax=Microvirga sp. M2 TaxID=3073270 RepID=UPI0039C1C4B1